VGPILAAFRDAPDVIALDLPGFGESDPPDQAWDVDCYARFMIHFLDELAVERAHLVGHSHGGRVSIALAADEADRRLADIDREEQRRGENGG
jgi:pimeloyl-ACP methyl ester carboxylesterase